MWNFEWEISHASNSTLVSFSLKEPWILERWDQQETKQKEFLVGCSWLEEWDERDEGNLVILKINFKLTTKGKILCFN